MKPHKACRFCNIVGGKYLYEGIDEPFASNNGFIAVASIGAMVEGWSLVIPKEHQLSLRNVYGNPGFEDFMGIVFPSLSHLYGPLIAFEHGSNKEGSITACGTDHAHLHLVPFRESLTPELQNSGMQWVQCHPSEILLRAGKSEYLFYCELESVKGWLNPIGYLHVLERPISQFFRHLIAQRNGHSEISDYRRFPHLDTARQTRSLLTGAVS